MQYPVDMRIGFDHLLESCKTSTSEVLEREIQSWTTDPRTISKLGALDSVLPTAISTRLLFHVSSRSYKDTTHKVNMLVNKHNADVNAIEPTSNNPRRTMLSVAIGGRRDDAALALLDLNAGANLEIGMRGQHPLIDTAFKGSPVVLKSLYTHGADMNITNAWGNTVLVAAVTSGNLDNVRFLLETVGLDPNTNGGTGLRVMELYDKNVPLEHDTSWNVRRDHQWSPLHAAVHLKHADGVEMVKLLLKTGANVHHRCELPHTSRDWVSPMGYTPLELLTVQALLPGATNERDDKAAMAECQNILEVATTGDVSV